MAASGAIPLLAPGQVPEAPRPQTSIQQGSFAEARALIADGQYQHAKAVLAAILNTEDKSVEGHALMGLTLEHLDDPKGSLEEYTKSAALKQPTAFDLENVAKDYVLLGDLTSAEHWAQVATQLAPRDAEAWYVLGRIRYTLQHFQEAANCFKQSLALMPRSAKAENNLGLSYEGLNRDAEAEAAYRQAIEWQQQEPHPSEQPLLNLGIVLLHAGKLDEAERLLTQAAAIAPQDERILEQLGHLDLDRKRYPEAQERLLAALKLDPKKASLHFLLGKVYHLEGREKEATAEFAQASVLSGYHATPEPF
jgi:Flp pilus assembly protein TadD